MTTLLQLVTKGIDIIEKMDNPSPYYKDVLMLLQCEYCNLKEIEMLDNIKVIN